MEGELSKGVDRAENPSRRNTKSVIDVATSYFNAAQDKDVMALYADPLLGRAVGLSDDSRMITDFVRCSYLGLDNHPYIVDGAVKALRDTGTLHWSCARTRLNFTNLGRLETALSDLFDARVVTFTSVLAANMSALPLIASGHFTGGRKPVMVFDRLAHATLAFHKGTIADETRVETIAHNDIVVLERLCREHETVAYICDGVYSMGGTAPIAELRTLQETYGLFLYIDDAHGISLFGKHGEGFAKSQIGDLGKRTIIAASLGKGFGASGGMVMLGTVEQENMFRRFAVAQAFSASLNMAAIGAALASIRLHRSTLLSRLQRTLQERIALFDSLIASEQRGAPLPIRTIRFGDEEKAIAVASELLERGFYAAAVFFPTVARGRAGLRICLTAAHSEGEIRGLCTAIRAICEDVPAPDA